MLSQNPSAVFQRAKRAYEREADLVLHKCRQDSRWYRDLGDYYLTHENAILATWIDPEQEVDAVLERLHEDRSRERPWSCPSTEASLLLGTLAVALASTSRRKVLKQTGAHGMAVH